MKMTDDNSKHLKLFTCNYTDYTVPLLHCSSRVDHAILPRHFPAGAVEVEPQRFPDSLRFSGSVVVATCWLRNLGDVDFLSPCSINAIPVSVFCVNGEWCRVSDAQQVVQHHGSLCQFLNVLWKLIGIAEQESEALCQDAKRVFHHTSRS